jgi:glycosyltransferase involved in cell wall biosynthesis
MTAFNVKIVIPALNEAEAIAGVVNAVKSQVNDVIVVDNGSTDDTAEVAKAAGATVVSVPVPGYGRACLAGIDAAGACDIIVFMDGDAADDPDDLQNLLNPIRTGKVAFTLGSRLIGDVEEGALTLPQRFGNSLACFLMRLIWKSRFTDLGPFRAIRRDALEKLNMQAPTFGWTVEMQTRILKHGVSYKEVPVRYKKRIGTSKISGTAKGVILAGWYILTTIFIEAVRQ